MKKTDYLIELMWWDFHENIYAEICIRNNEASFVWDSEGVFCNAWTPSIDLLLPDISFPATIDWELGSMLTLKKVSN